MTRLGGVLLIDVDSKIPNLALMQVSSYYRERGYEVGFNVENPDEVWISCIYTKNRPRALGIAKMYPDAAIHIGGSGVNYDWLPAPMQKTFPDYSLYPGIKYSMGFTTRGCIRRCAFCIVPKKEGTLRRWQHPKEFFNPKFDRIMLLDNNWLADKEWFFETSKWICEHKLKLIEHGMDIRLLTPNIAKRLREIECERGLHFAWDNMGDEKALRNGLTLLKNTGFNIRSEIQIYVLVGYNTSPAEDIYRCRTLKELGTNAYVMPYKDTKWTRRLARWANRKWLYWSCDIEGFLSATYSRRKQRGGCHGRETCGVRRSAASAHRMAWL